MHSSNFDDDSFLFILQDSVSLSSRHSADVEELGTIDHAIVVSTCDADALGIDLEAEGAFILPEGRRHSMSAGEGELRAVLGCGRVAGLAHVLQRKGGDDVSYHGGRG